MGFGLFWGHRSQQRARSLRPQPQGSPPLGFCSPPGGSQGSPTPQEAVWGRWGPVGAFPPQRGRRAGEANKGSLVYTKITEMFYSKKKKRKKKNEKISFTKERTQHGSCRTHANPQAARGTQARHLHACQGRILFRSRASSFSGQLPLTSPNLFQAASASPQLPRAAPGDIGPFPHPARIPFCTQRCPACAQGGSGKALGRILAAKPPSALLAGAQKLPKAFSLPFFSPFLPTLFFSLIMGCAQEVPGPSSFGDTSLRAACSLARCCRQN